MKASLLNQHIRAGSNANDSSWFWSGLDGVAGWIVNACVELFSYLLLAAIDS